MSPLEFWFDFGSTYSYPAAMRVEALTREAGVPLVWRSFVLGALFQRQGWDTSPFVLNPVRGRYMWRDVERTCTDLSLPFRMPSAFPRNGLLAARVVCRFEEEPWVPSFVRAVYRANFEHDREISDPTVVADCLTAVDQDPPRVLAEAGADANKRKLRERTDEAWSRGVFGSPTFLAGDEVFWGNDRLENAVRWWRRGEQAALRLR